MQLFKLFVALTFVFGACACSNSSSASSDGSSSSSSSSDGTGEVSLSGSQGSATLSGDKVELKDGSVLVNGVSFGSVPQGAEVKYIVTAAGRSLYVSGQVRNAPK